MRPISEAPPAWQACPADDLSWARWDEHSVICHRPSGQTHFVNAATEYLLTQVLQKPADVDAVVMALNGLSAGQGPPLQRNQALSLLLRLEALGLVERAGFSGSG